MPKISDAAQTCANFLAAGGVGGVLALVIAWVHHERRRRD